LRSSRTLTTAHGCFVEGEGEAPWSPPTVHGDVATGDDHPADGGGVDPEPDRRSATGERRRVSSWTSPRTVSDMTAL
jgi:hypothetical protein